MVDQGMDEATGTSEVAQLAGELERRIVTKAMAWSVPVVLAAVSAPAVAASAEQGSAAGACADGSVTVAAMAGGTLKPNSGQGPATVTGPGLVVTNTGKLQVRMTCVLQVTSGESTLTVDSYSLTATSKQDATMPMVLPAGSSKSVYVTPRTDSAAGQLTMDCGSYVFPRL